jgi:hypothetical protein
VHSLELCVVGHHACGTRERVIASTGMQANGVVAATPASPCDIIREREAGANNTKPVRKHTALIHC